ncbi:AAA family ATPase [Lentibacillus amyloliquefaciens]|uniref:Magnesium chelatase n=1 Tax=Lentibacillus amyloliquefaciens TaxID=1472767 RepID=A0A0U4E2V6_9BACI|nr:MoxR family ATPase [Lentibacillus amyloliquefaciens]ALX47217.1 magnesium chelatase [Lentibacillus amyloliquefaciens]
MDTFQRLTQAKETVNRTIIGQKDAIDLVFVALIAGGHVILESVPGSGKTKIAKTFAKVIDGQFSRIQFTPDVLPSDVTGIRFFNPKTQDFELLRGPVETNILLADEINRATPRTQSSLLEVMEEQQTTIDGTTVKIPSPFFVIATQNPIESSQGTFPLPEAQLDRFLMKITMNYPTLEQEKEILLNQRTNDPFDEILPLLSADAINSLQQQVRQVNLSDIVLDYLLQLVRQTRKHQAIELGVGSRAALALMRAGQAHAFMNGRDFVKPHDIKVIARFVFEHRIILTMDSSIRRDKSEVVREVIESVEVPVEAGSMR